MNLHRRIVKGATSPLGRWARIIGGGILIFAGSEAGGAVGFMVAATGLVAALPALLGTCA